MVQVDNQKYVKDFLLFSYSVNSQIWLDQLMDDCHLGYITKLVVGGGGGGEDNAPPTITPNICVKKLILAIDF
jgi:hypothetical protein